MVCFLLRKLIPSTYAGVSRDGYAANSQVFMKTWMAILLLNCTRSALHGRPGILERTGSEWYKYDFIAKACDGMTRHASGAKTWSVKQLHRALKFPCEVDPDCVFFPSRLRGHVAKYVGQNVFFLMPDLISDCCGERNS